ncbi:hypothetical protein A2368_02235 [Candidatus Collierbacteria bacterium RIFOXYB1_FULL_49_13]|uniref:Uncharacterized protein n=1 Tax=Candidatus Collierbacteria bacterium RIFOXYB1_FULL_49_13 TaxID=1817728 RepID=A0A1F5FII3_9BACT|nr:MAG: hypothetical protein A2368_02235 [Candidatus Collierbacteria bacterium RIFOXYB1_FULL_49_13]
MSHGTLIAKWSLPLVFSKVSAVDVYQLNTGGLRVELNQDRAPVVDHNLRDANHFGVFPILANGFVVRELEDGMEVTTWYPPKSRAAQILFLGLIAQGAQKDGLVRIK